MEREIKARKVSQEAGLARLGKIDFHTATETLTGAIA